MINRLKLSKIRTVPINPPNRIPGWVCFSGRFSVMTFWFRRWDLWADGRSELSWTRGTCLILNVNVVFGSFLSKGEIRIGKIFSFGRAGVPGVFYCSDKLGIICLLLGGYLSFFVDNVLLNNKVELWGFYDQKTVLFKWIEWVHKC